MWKNPESKKMKAQLKVLRNFYKYSAANIVPFGYNVGASLDPVVFPNLKVAPKDITALTDTLSDKLAAMQTGGKVETAAKQKAFEALTDALNADANVVEDTVGTDLEMLLATGYLPASTNRSSSPLDDTSIVSLLNNGTTQALLRLEPVTNAKTYQVQVCADGGKTWLEWCMSTQAPAHRADEPCAGHDVSRAGAGHRRQHRGQQLDQSRLHHVNMKPPGRVEMEVRSWQLEKPSPHPNPLSFLEGSGEGVTIHDVTM